MGQKWRLLVIDRKGAEEVPNPDYHVHVDMGKVKKKKKKVRL